MISLEYIWLIAALVSGLMLTHSSCSSHSAILDPDGKYHLSWNFTETDITFEVQVETLGYIGLGISPNGGMPGSDIVIVWVNDVTGEASVSDRHAIANAEPEVDDLQDYVVVSGSQNATHTVVKFRRDLDICDIGDNLITADTIRLIWSYHAEDPDVNGHAMYHGINRGTRSVFLLNEFQLERPNSPVVTTVDFLSDRVELPTKDTYYSCRSFQLPPFDRKHHFIGLEPIIQDGHEQHVHHILLYGCLHNVSESSINVQHECPHRDMPLDWWQCTALYLGWAIGGGNYYLPDHVGIPVGTDEDPTLWLMQVHYDNSQLKSGIVDSSGIRLIFTPELRQFDAGLIETGARVGVTQMIPPFEPNFLYTGHCVPECYEQAMAAANVTEIKVIGTLLHTHLIGKAVRVRHFRQGVELEPIAEDMNYDFNLQEMRFRSREVTLLPGDHTETECMYNSRHRSNITFGGLGTKDEMCLAFMLYYPKIPMSICQTFPRPSFVAKFAGVTANDLGVILDPPELANKGPLNLNELVDWRNRTIRQGFQSLLKMRQPDSYISVCVHGPIQYPSHAAIVGPPKLSIELPAVHLSKCRVNAARSTHSLTCFYLSLVPVIFHFVLSL